ncbi:MAG: tyrosine-type recombinase/integrase [Sulfurovum sp.]|nr:MAG: tyrosine-type recombinase/integrase [Sulfurovum sp.]
MSALKIQPTKTNKLTIATVKSAVCETVKGVKKDKRFTDGGGLFLLATAKDTKLWRFSYSFKNKKEMFSIGRYPNLSLKEAREKVLECKSLIAKGINPNEQKRDNKKVVQMATKNTFKEITKDWLKLQETKLSQSTITRYIKSLEKDFYPLFGDKEMAKIEKREIAYMAQMIQARGALEGGARALNLYTQIERYAFHMDRIDKTISNGIDKKSILKTHTKNNYRTITDPKRIGELMRAIDMYKGDRATVQALKILPFVFVRPSNLRMMEWKELDFEANTWTIPADKMKMKKEHKLPLHPKVIELIKEIEPYTKNFKYVFPSPFKTNEPLSDNTFNLALKRLDFGGEIVAHGFRAMFSTVAYESGLFKGEVIEALMAHQDTNQIRRAYNRATYEDSKKEVITWYGDFLEDVKQNKEVR